jgi:hypothetical protein
MASITLTIPDAVVGRVIDALCLAGGWTAELGVTKPAFAKSEAARIIRERVVAIERGALRAQAEQSAATVTEPDVS